jgi:hypothetical protein
MDDHLCWGQPQLWFGVNETPILSHIIHRRINNGLAPVTGRVFVFVATYP